MINSNVKSLKIVTGLSIIFIMLSAIPLEKALIQTLNYFHEPIPLIKGQPVLYPKELKKFIARDIIVNLIIGFPFLTAGIGCLYLKNWARKLILLIGIVGISYQAVMIYQEVYKYNRYGVFSYRTGLILFFVVLLVLMSIKKIRILFSHNQQE